MLNSRQIAGQEIAGRGKILLVQAAVDVQGIFDFISTGVPCDLDAFRVDGGEAVEKTFRGLEYEGGKAGAVSITFLGAAEPVEMFLSHLQGNPELVQQAWSPRPRGEDELRGPEDASVCGDDDLSVPLLPARDADTGFQPRSLDDRLGGVRFDAILNQEIARLFFIYRRHGVGQPEAGEASLRRRGFELFHLQVVFAGASENPVDDESTRGTGLQESGLEAEPLSTRILQLVPELVRPLKQRNIVGMLEIGHPDDPGIAMGTPAVVAGSEPIDSENLQPSPGKMVEGRASRAAHPGDNAIIGFHSGPSAGLSTAEKG